MARSLSEVLAMCRDLEPGGGLNQILETNTPPALVLRRLNVTDIGQIIQTDREVKGILLAPEFQLVDLRDGRKVGPILDYFVAPKDTRFLLEGPGHLDTFEGHKMDC